MLELLHLLLSTTLLLNGVLCQLNGGNVGMLGCIGSAHGDTCAI